MLSSEGANSAGEQLLGYKHPGGEVKGKAIVDTVSTFTFGPKERFAIHACLTQEGSAPPAGSRHVSSTCTLRTSFAAYTQAPAQQQKENRQMFVDVVSK